MRHKYFELVKLSSHFRFRVFNLNFIPEFRKRDIHLFRGYIIIPTFSFYYFGWEFVFSLHWLKWTIDFHLFIMRRKAKVKDKSNDRNYRRT